jgi:uroporphyrinogen decarboxylase
MTSKERVMTMLNHQRPDRIPKFDGFWSEFATKCYQELNIPSGTNLDDYFCIDIAIVVADETAFPTRAKTISQDSQGTVSQNSWGGIVRTRPGSYFYEELDTIIKDKSDLDKIEFDSPYLDFRYGGFNPESFRNSKRCIFCKTGGPFLRSSHVRGKQNFLYDIAGDPEFAKALAMRVAEHIAEIGKESLRRGDLYDTGVFIYDDMGSNLQPLMSPASFEKIFLPGYRHMVKSFKEAGAAKVCLHSDGNVEPLLDMLIDAGIDAFNPVEPKAGLNIPRLKAKYGKKLAYIGGMCNAHVLPRGSFAEIEAQAGEIIEVAKDGGVAIGAHSIGPDIPVKNYLHYHEFVMKYGNFEID